VKSGKGRDSAAEWTMGHRLDPLGQKGTMGLCGAPRRSSMAGGRWAAAVDRQWLAKEEVAGKLAHLEALISGSDLV
jgi:hypothetical protein